MVQRLCPDHEVKHLVLCRGTDRYSGPTKALSPGHAPLRRRICIRRKHEDLVIDPEWEAWERLTFKGLRRKGTPARVSLSIFASPKLQSSPMPVQSQPSSVKGTSADVAQPRREFPELELPASKRVCTGAHQSAIPESEASPSELLPETPMSRETIDVATQKHG